MTQQSDVAMARAPLPTATAKIDQDAEAARRFFPRAPTAEGEVVEAPSKSSRCREKIGSSPRLPGTSFRGGVIVDMFDGVAEPEEGGQGKRAGAGAARQRGNGPDEGEKGGRGGAEDDGG